MTSFNWLIHKTAGKLEAGGGWYLLRANSQNTNERGLIMVVAQETTMSLLPVI